MLTLSQASELVNSYLESHPYTNEPQNLYAPINYILKIGGKRIRPVLMLLAYNLYKENFEAILPQALALETCHNFTLLHDDLMDRSDLRRGNPTVHKKWDDNTAILSGDAMLVLSFKLFGNNCASADFTEAILGVCEGQQYDMDFESRNDVTESEYMEMIRLKTSLLLGYALKIGAKLAGASEEDAQHLYDFGEKMGLAFQIQDDLLDVYGDPALFKKKLGGDIVENKKTLLLITALNTCTGTDKVELDRRIAGENLSEEEKIQGVKNIYDKIGMQDTIQEKIESMFALSLKHLDQVSVSDDKKVELKNFANKLLNRKY